MEDVAVAVEELRKSYGDAIAVDGVSFAVATGEIVAILGPNGAGKTTTVEILEGFRPRSGGKVEVLGCDPERGGADFRARIGVVLQGSEPDPYLRVAETIELFRGYYREPRATDELLELVDLRSEREQRVRDLSGGQRRRLDLALALVGRPELVFLDEPTTGFDPAARRDAWGLIRGLRANGTTVVLTTHYLEEAAALADRLVVLARGRIVAEGPPRSIGARSQCTRITFDEPADAIDVIQRCPCPLTRSDGSWFLEVADPVLALSQLTSWALEAGVPLANLTVAPRSLEDVYLELIA